MGIYGLAWGVVIGSVFYLLVQIPTLINLRNGSLGFLRNTYYVIRNATILLGTTVLALTAIWAFAFQSIYLRDETRMAASRWMFKNVPSAINLSFDEKSLPERFDL